MRRAFTLLASLPLAGLLFVGCIKPTSGDYEFDDVGPVNTDCETTGDDTASSEEPEAVTIGVKVLEENVGMVLQFSEDFSKKCSLDGMSFDCVITKTSISGETSGNDAVVQTIWSWVGKWAASSKLSLNSLVVTACEGPDCDAMEELGYQFCATEVALEGNLVE